MTDKHAAARDLYQRYQARAARLSVLREYAKAVIEATGGSSRTPVEPLATMGTGGGPLLCDVCRKPMILEGGGYQGVYADAGWKRNPQKGWVSYISGGMLLVTESNGTLRVYHGHPYGDGCVGRGDKMLDEARMAYSKPDDAMEQLDALEAYLREEGPACDIDATVSDVHKVMLKFDPGDGVNQP